MTPPRGSVDIMIIATLSMLLPVIFLSVVNTLGKSYNKTYLLLDEHQFVVEQILDYDRELPTTKIFNNGSLKPLPPRLDYGRYSVKNSGKSPAICLLLEFMEAEWRRGGWECE